MSWYSWWIGSLGSRAGRVQQNVEVSELKSDKQRVALIIGVTGIVGNSLAEILHLSDTPGGPWKVYGVARRPKPNWSPDTPVEYIQCDVLNRGETLERISTLKDVTHLFWVCWVSRETEEQNCEDNGRMFHNVLDALLPNAENLEHICLQTGGKHYVGSFDNLNKNKKFQPHEPPFHEELTRVPGPNFYYTLEDILFDAAKKKKGLTWSIHRPTHIFGFSPWSLMNIIEQEIWAATEPCAQNQAFNCTNGDVVKWKKLWKQIAEKFELEMLPYEGEGFSLAEAMKDKGPIWEAIVKENNLCSTKIEEVGTWWFVDLVLNVPFEGAFSMNKSKEYGFFGFRNTESSLLSWIDKMKLSKIIP
ncbi:hypothetical protein SUGI_0252970 [Cryptomeria japonica]|nr:hypothetical protein SUGI_0252970 [Cryptomeria japonica]